MFANILVRKESSMAICKIYDFKYVAKAHMRFVKAWGPKTGQSKYKGY